MSLYVPFGFDLNWLFDEREKPVTLTVFKMKTLPAFFLAFGQLF